MSRPDVEDTGEGQIHGGPVDASPSTARRSSVDEIVVAAGRTPRPRTSGWTPSGVATRARLRRRPTTTWRSPACGDWLYAVGDISGRALLTHMGKYQARIAGDVIAARAEGRSTDGTRYRDLADHDMVPQVDVRRARRSRRSA